MLIPALHFGSASISGVILKHRPKENMEKSVRQVDVS
jgi:hypothetical protein